MRQINRRESNKSLKTYTQDRPRGMNNSPKWLKPSPLNTIFSQRQKRMLGIVVLWDFKREEGNSQEDEKTNVW